MVDRPSGDMAREHLGCVTLSDYDDVPGFIIALLSHSKQPDGVTASPSEPWSVRLESFLLLHRSLREAELKFDWRLD